MQVQVYNKENQKKLMKFFYLAFKENNRHIDLFGKDCDLLDIENVYLKDGCFWILTKDNDKIIGTIALRKLEGFYEIRRFFISKKYKNKGYGQLLLHTLIYYAIQNNIQILKAATLEDGNVVQYLFNKFGFKLTKRYNNSSADIFYKLTLTDKYIYAYLLKKLENNYKKSLILNPTENIPYNTNTNYFFEGLYVSERLKDVNDKVIFAGRNEYIKFFEFIKQVWKRKLNAQDIDLKTLSGLNAHLILFLCILYKNETVLLLPEVCGGHFATQKILESIGANVITMIPDYNNMCIDIEATKKLIENINPKYIFVDRSEGLTYEDFSWLKAYNEPYKIFDASQYLVQIINNDYQSPFDMGFDMIVSTLHKNYPGPQKGIIAVNNENNAIWKRYLNNAKTYISNTHPMAIANSINFALDDNRIDKYSKDCLKCLKLLEQELIKLNLPVIKRDYNLPYTLHLWILCETKELSYNYYLKLESLNILTNYRLLPYNLGYGLRIGVGGAVRSGLTSKHIQRLASIMAEAYFQPIITQKLENKASALIRRIHCNIIG